MTYQSEVLADGPLAYWRLGESVGTTAADASGGGRPGAYTATGVTYAQAGALLGGGDADPAVQLDGSAGSVAVPHDAVFNLTGSFTLEAWVFPTSRANYYMLATKCLTNGATNSTFEWRLDQTSGLPNFLQVTGSGQQILIAAAAPPLNAWSHLALTKSGPTVTHYLNGAANGTAAFNAAGVTTNTETVKLGRRTDGFFFLGRLDEVAIYPTALAPARLRAHVNAALGSYAAAVLADNPLVYWRMSDAAGATAADASGNGRHGLYTGGYTLGQPGALATGEAAVAFDGVSGVLTLNPVPTTATANVTLELWAYIPSLPSMGCLIKVGDVPNGYGLGIGTVQFDLVGSFAVILYENVRWITTSRQLHTGWNHLAVVLNASGQPTLYHDGAVGFSGAGTGPIAPSGTMRVGGYALTAPDTPVNRFVNCRIDEVAVYGTALSATRMAVHYAARLTTLAADAVRRWNGAAWVTAAVQRWDGSAWQPATARRWDGTQWV